ncbi:MAG: caspase family protein [Fibrobacteria bacterium]|nr:caspase family protein [Fibrobacteria bacterium]
MRIAIILIIIFMVSLSLAKDSKDDNNRLKRYALVVGANYGGKERVLLKYAQTDAVAFAKVLKDLGGVENTDVSLLRDPSRSEFLSSLYAIKEKLELDKETFRRLEMVIYYSGHADEDGLMLGDEKLTYKDFKSGIKRMPADVRIAVLDACAAGALTRLKGGKKRPAFMVDESADMKGYAFLTSNTADEVAQESDKINGSFFTHSLVSGLRGAADITLDKKVTLNEAYQYAFHETLSRTEGTRGGAQHAGYDMQLSGTGEVVMTDLRGTSATLSLDEQMDGRVYVRDENGVLIVELKKYKGRNVELGLEPGAYKVMLEKSGPMFQAAVTLKKDKETLLNENQMKEMTLGATVSRGSVQPGNAKVDSLSFGDALAQAGSAIGVVAGKAAEEVKKAFNANDKKPDSTSEQVETLVVQEEYDTIPISFAIIPAWQKKNGQYRLPRTLHYQSFNLLFGGYYQLQGLGIGLLGQWAVEDVDGVQIAIGGNYAGRNMDGVQISSYLNIAGTVKGWQATTFLNLAHDVKGFQVSSFGNLAINVKGGQGAAFGNIAYDVVGGQGAAFANCARDVRGGQGAAFANFARNVEGGQGAAFANFALDLKGGQGSAFANFARDVTGGQGTVFANFARDVTGGQVSMFMNAARDVKGFQVGLFNFARSVEGETFGILNINKNAEIHPGVWVDEAGVVNLSLKTGNRYFYGMVNAGIHAKEEKNRERLLVSGVGLGAAIPVKMFFINTDISQSHVAVSNKYFTTLGSSLYRLRVGGGMKIFNHLRLNGGVSFNIMQHNGKTLDYQDYLDTKSWGKDDKFTYWQGFYAGVDF